MILRQLKKTMSAVLLFSLLISLYGCGSSDPGTAPVISYESNEITLGEATLGEMIDAGYDVGIYGSDESDYALPGRTWLAEFLTAKMDDTTYAYLYVYNPEKEDLSLDQCTLNKIKIGFPYDDQNVYWADNTLVNGINFTGMNYEEVKSTMSEFDLSKETEGFSQTYEDGEFTYLFYFDEQSDTVKEVLIEDEIGKTYS